MSCQRDVISVWKLPFSLSAEKLAFPGLMNIQITKLIFLGIYKVASSCSVPPHLFQGHTSEKAPEKFTSSI